MAPIPTSPAAPQSTSHGSSSFPTVFTDNKRLLIYAAFVLVAILLFLAAGVYLLHLLRRRRQQSGTTKEDEDQQLRNASAAEAHRQPLARGCSSSTTLNGGTHTGNAEKVEGQAPGQIIGNLRTQRCNESESTTQPSVPVTDPPKVLASESGFSDNPSELLALPSANEDFPHDKLVAPGMPVLDTKLTNVDTANAVQSAEPFRPPVTRTGPKHENHENIASPGKHKKASCKGPKVDRGEALLKRLDAIIAQEPTFLVPDESMPFPLVTVDVTRRGRVMNMLDDIIAQEPPPLSPASDTSDSDASSVESPFPVTPPTLAVDQGLQVLPPLDVVLLLRLPSPSPEHRVVLLPESSPPLMQEYFIWPVKKTWSKITGHGVSPVQSPPAIVLEDTALGELPLQIPDGGSLLRYETSPEMDYLQPPPPSWNAPREEDAKPVCVPRRIVRPVRPMYVRGPTPFLKPRRSQLRGPPVRPTGVQVSSLGPGAGLGLSIPREHPGSASVPSVSLSNAGVPPRMIAAARPADKAASLYSYV
ncbi:uncharacterized protein C8Q71DRAFT_858823 [Rhodofomes roseus]|uniref:Uncharacterized protein n=1 Tax=Rhodofomes roseus TaxID=34475 RepID=A0ABQ8KCS4_9APHY|nr:uncharacterized protein C8Q71DRAFT_858823 [Rhodofomes roseus]KAH9835162.1 hypothetical protein C8Q71DRAFT_858823 [Rhodofomes roseus]